VKDPDSVSQVFYDVVTARSDEGGYAVVSANVNPSIKDSVFIRVIGPRAKLLSAITRDENGNGYLDAVVLTFDKEVSLPAEFNVLNNILLTRKGQPLMIDSISGRGTKDIVFTLYLREPEPGSGAGPQTDWTPLLSIHNLELAEEVRNVPTIDGAGPVVWRVEKFVNSAGDRTKDRVEVTLSEPIVEADGDPFALTNRPSDVFHVWVTDSAGTFVRDSLVLDGIGQFAEKREDQLVFYMTNGAELTSYHHFNLRTDKDLVADAAERNLPGENNHKVRVVISGAPGELIVGPNPFPPTFFVPPGEGASGQRQTTLMSHPAMYVYQWVQNKGGAAIKIQLTLPDDATTPAKVVLMVFDAVGNLVHKRATDNAIPQDWRDNWLGGTSRDLNFYWNGITDRDTRAAPGIYRMIVYLHFVGGERKFSKNVGIAR
jgi:hypothetical protein